MFDRAALLPSAATRKDLKPGVVPIVGHLVLSVYAKPPLPSQPYDSTLRLPHSTTTTFSNRVIISTGLLHSRCHLLVRVLCFRITRLYPSLSQKTREHTNWCTYTYIPENNFFFCYSSIIANPSLQKYKRI